MDDLTFCIIIGVVFAMIIAGFICMTFYNAMKTAKEKTEANDYMSQKDLILELSQDHYLGTFTTKTPLPKPNDKH